MCIRSGEFDIRFAKFSKISGDHAMDYDSLRCDNRVVAAAG